MPPHLDKIEEVRTLQSATTGAENTLTHVEEVFEQLLERLKPVTMPQPVDKTRGEFESHAADAIARIDAVTDRMQLLGETIEKLLPRLALG